MLDIDYGLWLGILISFFLNTFRHQRLKLVELGQIKDYELHFNKKKYFTQDCKASIRIIRPTQPIFFINSDNFRDLLFEMCPIKEVTTAKTICENVILFIIYLFFFNINKSQFFKIISKCFSNYGCFLCCNENENKSECDKNIGNSLLNKEESLKLNKCSKSCCDIIIIDMTLVQFIDETGVKCLTQVFNEYTKDNVNLMFTNINGKN